MLYNKKILYGEIFNILYYYIKNNGIKYL